MTDRISYTSSAPTTQFILGCDRISQSVTGNYTRVRIYLKAFNRGNTTSYSNYYGIQTASIDGIGQVGKRSANPFIEYGVSNGVQRWHNYWDVNIPHSANGKRGAIKLRMALNYDNGGVKGSWTAWFNSFPNIKVKRRPSPPTSPKLDTIKSTSMRYLFKSPKDKGNLPILQYKIGYGINSGSTQKEINVSGSPKTITGLKPNTKYYFWSKARNAEGWSSWSVRAMVKTISTPPKPTPLSLTKERPQTVKYRFQNNGNGGAPVLEWQAGYGTYPDAPRIFVASSGTSYISGITTGTTWYFWSRGRNSEGWGPWSARLSITIPTGVRIKIDDHIVEAIPYVKHNDHYEEALPYVKYTGVWKPTG